MAHLLDSRSDHFTRRKKAPIFIE